MVNFYDELSSEFKEIKPLEFYRRLFPKGELDTKDDFTKGKFTGIACEFTDLKKADGSPLVKRYSITDELDSIRTLLKSKHFTILSPISYVGKSRQTANARRMYAFAIEIDDLKVNEDGRSVGFYDLIHQMKKDILPQANYIVASGNGLHLYYLFEKPLVLYRNVIKSLANYKRHMTPNFWNRYITTSYTKDKMQFESAFQGFRLVGGVSKAGDRTRVFEVSKKKISVEYLNSFADDKNKIEISYQSELSLEEAREKYPQWYENRIVKGKPKSSWTCKRDLYDWWLRKIKSDSKVGHRYYCLMMLSIYAIKSGIHYEELEKDAFSLLEPFDEMSDDSTNRFTKKDVLDALQCFHDKDLVTYPINSISNLSGIEIKKNKRNYRNQDLHLKLARSQLSVLKEMGEVEVGRPKGSGTKEQLVKDYIKKYPNHTPTQIAKALKISRTTVYKYK